MIVDDDYIVIGSANINQRSMAGERDSEICIGAFQPDHSVSEGSPRGDIHTFRMALWSAHLGGHSSQFQDPSTEDCLSYVRSTTKEFWEVYTADQPQGSEVHLLPYPLVISETGDVNPLDHPWDSFPGRYLKDKAVRLTQYFYHFFLFRHSGLSQGSQEWGPAF